MGATVKPVAPPSFCQRSCALARCARIKAVESARKLLCLCTTAKWSPARGSHSRISARRVCNPAGIFSSRLVCRCEPPSQVAAARPARPPVKCVWRASSATKLALLEVGGVSWDLQQSRGLGSSMATRISGWMREEGFHLVQCRPSESEVGFVKVYSRLVCRNDGRDGALFLRASIPKFW